jgi:transposase
MSTAPAWVTLDVGELNELLARASRVLDEPDHEKLRLTVEGFIELVRLLEDKRMSIKRLRQMLFGARTEKTNDVLAGDGHDTSSRPASHHHNAKQRPRKGHGRRPANDYTGAQTLAIAHPTLQPGHGCPHCDKGKVYTQSAPGLMLRIVGQAPLGATRYELDKLRCNLCGDVFTAAPPEAAAVDKYDESAAAMIAMLKYGSGFPFHRLALMQQHLGIPVPASTQWDIVKRAASQLAPVHDELIRHGAQRELMHNDDTTMKVLELMDPDTRREAFADLSPQRSGVFTSGIVSIREQHTIALFFTGAKHAGENLEQVLTQRACELGPPIQMCDALSRNVSPEFDTLVANCNAHARRKFVELVPNFPDECRRVLETLREVYKNDAIAKNDALSAQQRLVFHQTHSASLMDELHAWMQQQITDKRVEPNSGLGQAIAYMTNHWHKLTLFLQIPGAPLDNNICERILKKAILHRKSSLFFKTLNGARVGDLFMSVIYTCQFAGVDPFDYLIELLKHADELVLNPHQWMPWNYRDALARASPARACA